MKFENFSEEQVERILLEISKVGIANAEPLARLEVEETGYGTVEHKTLKNLFCGTTRSTPETAKQALFTSTRLANLTLSCARTWWQAWIQKNECIYLRVVVRLSHNHA